MLQQQSIEKLLSPDLSHASLLVVLLQLRVAIYLHARIDQLFPESWMSRLLEQKVKASKHIPGLMTELTEAHEMAIVGGTTVTPTRTLKGYTGLTWIPRDD